MAYSLNELNNRLPKLIVIMKKEEIYVSVESKKQAEMFRKVLESMGETICHDYYPFNEKTNRLCYVGGWYLSGEKFTKEKITFGELIDLLQKKPLLISEDGVPLYEDSDLFIVWKDNCKWEYDNHHKGFKSSDGEWYVNPKANIDERKLFSTKQAALEWIEAQKPKEIKVKLNNTYAIVHKRGIVTFESNAARLSFNHVKDIIKAMEELQNA